MTQGDKTFFTGLVKGLELKIDRNTELIQSNAQGIRSNGLMIKGLDERVQGNAQGIRNNGLIIKGLDERVRYNGLMIEALGDDMSQMREGDASIMALSEKVDALGGLNSDVAAIKRVTSNNSRRIKVLEAK